MKLNDIKYIKVRVGVRYWEDSDVNGEEDVTLSEVKEPTSPRMPFAVPNGRKEHICPYGGYDWIITINPNEGKIIDWPQGTTALVQYKSCDDNTIYFIGKNNEVLGEYEEYVPSFLSIDDSGYGDYVIMTILEDGTIKNFRFNEDDIEEVIENAF